MKILDSASATGCGIPVAFTAALMALERALGEREAGQPRLVVDQHRTGAAFAAIAAGLCAGETDYFPQIVQQQQVVGRRIGARPAVKGEFEEACHVWFP